MKQFLIILLVIIFPSFIGCAITSIDPMNENIPSYTFDINTEILTQLSQNTNSDCSLPKDHLKDKFHNFMYSMFRENDGQLSDNLAYYVITPQGLVGFDRSTVFFTVNGVSFQLSFLDAHMVQPIGVGELESYSNYFIGEETFIKIKHFSRVVYENLYDGITLQYRITAEGVKYEFLIEPYADINQIKMMYSGVDEVSVIPSRVELTVTDVTFVDESLDVWYADTGQRIVC